VSRAFTITLHNNSIANSRSHLLGKKSWNVYNPANIARVRRDEAAAQAREEAEEQRMQEVDADRRLAILRGEIPPPLEEPEPKSPTAAPPRDRGTGRKRKRNGEDDTDFEMRLVRERASAGDRAARELAVTKPAASPTSLVDSKGHIALFAEPEAPRRHERNPEAMQEAARKERELKDQYQMRLVNAAGKEGEGLTHSGPWYASADGEASGALMPSKNVWGRDDPRRKVREAARLDASDPLAMMKSGAKMVRELNKERKKEVEEREREIRALEKEQRREEKYRERKRRRDSVDKECDSTRPERSHPREEDDVKSKRSRSKGRDRLDSDGRDARPRQPNRPRRNDEEHARDASRERSKRQEGRHESRGHRDDERHRRSHQPPHDRGTDRGRDRDKNTERHRNSHSRDHR
jgi:hypothetical protein